MSTIFTIELLYFVIMIAVFIVLILVAKLPTGLSLMCSALAGFIISAIASGTPFDIRYLVEGMFGYIDTILIITSAMIFMGALDACGALEYISAVLVKALGRVPSLLLIAFMIIIMFPAMVTGSSLASAISAGALVAPIMIKWGIPKAKTGAIIAVGSILGMVAPPINVPAMVICDVVDIPFTDFSLPLLILALPLAIVSVLLLGRKYVKPIQKADVDKVVDVSILKELNWTVCIPLFVLILFIILEVIFPKIFGALGMTAMFVISSIVAFCVGRRRPLWPGRKKHAESGNAVKGPATVAEVLSKGVHKSFSAMGLLMGVGMFMEILSLVGPRGLIVTDAVSLPSIGKYIGMAVFLPLFGGISAFGSASMLGGPFVMALDGIAYSIMATSAFSLLAALGEFLPPTAMSATFAKDIVEEKSWTRITKAALPALGVIFVFSLVYVIWLANIVQKSTSQAVTILIIFAIVIVIAIVFAVIWEVLVCKVPYFKRQAHVVGEPAAATAEAEPEAEQLQQEITQAEINVEQTTTEAEEPTAGLPSESAPPDTGEEE